MKRIIAIGALLGALAVPFAAPAGASPRHHATTGTVSGGTRYVDGEGCFFQHQQFLFAVAYDRQWGAMYVNGCTFPDAGGSDVYPYEGVFTVWLRHGTLRGTVSGVTAHDLTTNVVVDLTLTVTGGSGKWSGTTGTIELDATWDAARPPSPDPVSGTITTALQ
jgi:hypothetical protein